MDCPLLGEDRRTCQRALPVASIVVAGRRAAQQLGEPLTPPMCQAGVVFEGRGARAPRGAETTGVGASLWTGLIFALPPCCTCCIRCTRRVATVNFSHRRLLHLLHALQIVFAQIACSSCSRGKGDFRPAKKNGNMSLIGRPP